MRLSTISKIIIVIIITLAITIIILYNYYHIDPAIFGPIGDSIGGTLTPFLSLITIIFIYETFLVEKSKSNLEKERHEAELLNKRIERIHDSIDNFYHVNISMPFGEPTLSELIKPTKEYNKKELLKGTVAILNYYEVFMKDYENQQTLLNPKDMELESMYLYSLNLIQNVKNFNPEQFFYKEEIILNIKMLYSGKLYKLILAFTSSFNKNHNLEPIFQQTLNAIRDINILYNSISQVELIQNEIKN